MPRLALLFALVTTTVVAAERPTPIAVMPFKNLNDDPALDWLEVGMAETMLSDLKKLAKVPVVERSQLDKAMAELALRGAGGSDESTAARVGKMVGARTIVIGGIQQSGKRLRITARFVNVETGEVLDTAKATGSLDGVFALQDEIVARLIGVEPRKMRPQARKPSSKTVKAYKLYALALTTASDADRVGYLRRSVKEDPQFSYALEDLERLERRIAEYGKANVQAVEEKEQALGAELSDPSLPAEERAQKATQLLSLLAAGQRWRSLSEEAERIYALDLPATAWGNPTELASYYAFLATYMNKDFDRALALGERHLKRFPGGTYYKSVEAQLNTLIDQRRAAAEDRPELDRRYAALDKERAEVEAEAKERGRAVPQIRYLSWAFRRCSEAHSLRQYDRAVTECPKYVATWSAAVPDPGLEDSARMFLFQARYFTALSNHELGRHAQARKALEELIEDEPKLARDMAVKTQLQFIPKD